MNAGKRLKRRSCCLLILCAGVLAGSAKPARANETKPAGGQANAVAPAYTVEALTCAPCHSGVVKSFGENPHAQPLSTRNAKGVTCASCHGSQRAHIESDGARSGTLDPALASARQVDDMCLACHAGTRARFDRSPHGKSNVSCTSCHRIHSADTPTYLLKAAQTELCYECHADVKPQFSMSFRHRVNEGLIQCTDCHDPHGTSLEERPGAFNRHDTFCTNCHAAIAGPFVFEHAVVKTEGCTACHVPHGGPNPHLLRRANVDTICQQCHFPPPNPRTGVHMPSANTGSSKSCIDCHTDVHGSGSSPAFLKAK